jgi:hypothetical protein
VSLKKAVILTRQVINMITADGGRISVSEAGDGGIKQPPLLKEKQ